ncbi:MAG TPA: glycosyltransferase [Mycobacteriales bacterium]|nr:glycosyltransferase [Mycobacteriales bacterium]
MSVRHAALVSVVIPTTGRRSLSSALRSAAVQPECGEVLVVLDRPEVRSEAAAQIRDLALGSTVRLLTTDGSRGGGAARNLGIRESQFDYVAFLDDDDWWEATKLRAQLAAVRRAADPARTISITGAYFHRLNGQTVAVPTTTYRADEGIATYIATRSKLRYGQSFVQSSTLLAPRGLLCRHPWDEDLRKYQDWDLIARLIREGGAELVQLREALAHVRQGSSDSLSLVPDTDAAMTWLARNEAALSTRARADFVCTEIARYEARRGMPAAALAHLADAIRLRPHTAALLLALAEICRSGMHAARDRLLRPARTRQSAVDTNAARRRLVS